MIGSQVVEARGDHLPRRTLPVQAKRILGPAIHRSQLLLAHIVSPAAAIDTLSSTHGGQREERAVNGIGVEVVIHTCAHDDLAAALGLCGIAGELAADADRCVCRHTGELFLPGWGAHDGGIVEILRPFTGQVEIRALHRIVRQHEIEHRGHELAVDLTRRDSAVHHSGPDWPVRIISIVSWQVEAREEHLDTLRVASGDISNGHDRIHAIEAQVPLSYALFAVAVGDSAAWINDLAVCLHDQQSVRGVRGVFQVFFLGVRRREELAWGVCPVAMFV